MKIIHNNPQLRNWLRRSPETVALAERSNFSFDDTLFGKALAQLAGNHPHMNQSQLELRAAYLLIMEGHSGSDPASKIKVPSIDHRLWKILWMIAVIVLLLVLAVRGHAQGNRTAGLSIRPQNQGTTLATRGGGLFILNCSTNLTCAWNDSMSTLTLSSAGGSGTGCTLQGGTNLLLYDTSTTCNDITKWSTNGTTTLTGAATAILDLSAAAQLKVPTSAGCAPTTSALACYDSTNHLWVFGNNGSTQVMCNTQGGTAGQVFESVGGTACGGYADPIVSGPDAPGAAPTKNPVQMGLFDGTNVQRVLGSAAGRLSIDVNSAPTTAVTGTFWPYTLGQQVAASSVPVILPSATITTLTPPTAAAIGTSTSADLLIGTQLAAASVPVALPTATITTLTPPTAAAIASAIVANPPTVPVTGTFWQITQPISAASLPLPTLAATSTKQSDGTQKTQIVDGSGNVVGTTSNSLNIQCANCSGSGASAVDGATFTAAASVFAPSGCFFQTTATSNPLTTGLQGMAQCTAQRALFNNLRNASGTEIGTSTTPLVTGLTVKNVSNVDTCVGYYATTPCLNLPVQSSSEGSTGSTVPTTAMTVGGTDGTNLRALKVSTTGIVSTDQSSQAGTAITTVPVAFGSGTPSGNAPGFNAAQFIGTTAQSNDGTAGFAGVGGHFADNGAAAATNRIPTLPCIYQTSLEAGTAATAGRNGALECGTDGLLWTAMLPAIRPASFMASASFAGSSTTDVARMPGNASNTVLVTKVILTCTQTTAGVVTVTVNKRSTAGSGGTSANMTVVPMDSNYAAGVSVPVSYTSTGPTVGTLVGQLDAQKIGCDAAATAGPNDVYVMDFSKKPIILRGTAENVAIGLGGAVTGGNLTTTFQWIETSTITP